MIDIVCVCRYQLRMNGQDLYREIGRRIRRLRKAAGQTQEQLAAQVGVSRASIANIEAGRQNFLLHYIYTIAEALDLGTPVSLLPGSHEGVTPAIDTAEVPLPQEGLTDKQREEVIRLMGGSGRQHGTNAPGEQS